MLGGQIGGILTQASAGPVTIKGGTISGDITLNSTTGGDVYIYGTNFTIDGNPVAPGTYNQSGTYTATLLDGQLLNNNISVNGANNIVLVPEPATLLLLAAGGLCIRKRKKAC